MWRQIMNKQVDASEEVVARKMQLPKSQEGKYHITRKGAHVMLIRFGSSENSVREHPG